MSILDDLHKGTMEFSKNNIYGELGLIRYLYITIGKLVSYDENFFFNQNKIYKLKGDPYINVETILKNKKINCYTISYIFEYICKMYGINIFTEVHEDGLGNIHYQNIVFIGNGRINVDLQLDLYRIHFGMITNEFKANRYTLKKIDKLIDYIGEDYIDSYLSPHKSINFCSLEEKMDTLIKMFESQNQFYSGYIERVKFLKYLINLYFGVYDKDYISHCTLYNRDKGYLSVVTFKNLFNAYLYNHNIRSYEKIPVQKLNSLLKVSNIVSGTINCGIDIL